MCRRPLVSLSNPLSMQKRAGQGTSIEPRTSHLIDSGIGVNRGTSAVVLFTFRPRHERTAGIGSPRCVQLLASSVRRQSPRAVPAGLVVGAGQAADDDAGLLVLCVDELAGADIDADVRQAPGVGVLEEDQVAGPQIAESHR